MGHRPVARCSTNDRCRRYPAIPAHIGQGLKSDPQATFGCGDFALINDFGKACGRRLPSPSFSRSQGYAALTATRDKADAGVEHAPPNSFRFWNLGTRVGRCHASSAIGDRRSGSGAGARPCGQGRGGAAHAAAPVASLSSASRPRSKARSSSACSTTAFASSASTAARSRRVKRQPRNSTLYPDSQAPSEIIPPVWGAALSAPSIGADGQAYS